MISILGAFLFVENEVSSWWNYPGWEAWKFFNLFVFAGLLIYILRRPLGESLIARREAIQRELKRAQDERIAALAKLEEVEVRLGRLNAEIETIRAQTHNEAEMERERVTRATDEEMKKLREQARKEIEEAGKAARQELRRYAAEQSVRLAEELIRSNIRPEDEVRLMGDYVQSLGGTGR